MIHCMTLQSTDQATTGITFRTKALPALRVMDERVTPLLDAALGAAAFEVFDVVGPEGAGPPPHSHVWDEGYIVIDGQLAVFDWSDDLEHPAEQVLEPGGSAFVPGGTTHSFQIRSIPCRFFVVTTPGAHALFADMDETVGGADDVEALVAVAKRNGMGSPLF